MLKSVRLKNFKLHEDTLIEAAPITVFIGPNNSGKSSIFQALLLLRQAASRGQANFLQPLNRETYSPQHPYQFAAHDLIDIGEFKDALRQGQNELLIAVRGYILHPGDLKRAVPDVEFDVAIRDNLIAYHEGHLESTRFKFKWDWAAPDRPSRPSIDLDGAKVTFTSVKEFRLISVAGFAGGSTDAEQYARAQEFAHYLENVPALLLRSIHPIYPLRGFEESGYPLPGQPAETQERLSLSDRAVALASLLAYDRDLEERLSVRLEELLQLRIKVRHLPGYRVTIWAERSPQRLLDKVLGGRETDTLFANEGTGANQLPFILVPVLLTPPNETILLSEPEAHLHPKAQCELTRMLLTVAKKENIQFLIETHSEHVLHRLLHAVAKQELKNDELAIYYFGNEKGVAKVRRLAINDRGQVDGGLPGFFDQSLSELSEYLEALKRP